jgi:hypothetical protein
MKLIDGREYYSYSEIMEIADKYELRLSESSNGLFNRIYLGKELFAKNSSKNPMYVLCNEFETVYGQNWLSKNQLQIEARKARKVLKELLSRIEECELNPELVKTKEEFFDKFQDLIDQL